MPRKELHLKPLNVKITHNQVEDAHLRVRSPEAGSSAPPLLDQLPFLPFPPGDESSSQGCYNPVRFLGKAVECVKDRLMSSWEGAGFP